MGTLISLKCVLIPSTRTLEGDYVLLPTSQTQTMETSSTEVIQGHLKNRDWRTVGESITPVLFILQNNSWLKNYIPSPSDCKCVQRVLQPTTTSSQCLILETKLKLLDHQQQTATTDSMAAVLACLRKQQQSTKKEVATPGRPYL